MKKQLTIGYASKDWKETWNIKELADTMKKLKLEYNIEVPQDEVDSTFMILSNRILTDKNAAGLWKAGLEFLDEDTVSGKDIGEVKTKLTKMREHANEF